MAEALSSLLWGWHVLGGILAAGAFFTVATGFYQLRCLGRWMKAALRPPPRQGGKLSSFQALSTALAGSIGTGNIVGVAAAITVGGPGALFWMWLSALLGMMTVYAENYLSAKHPGAPGALGYIRRAGRLGGLLAGWTLDLGGANCMLLACVLCGCAGVLVSLLALRRSVRREPRKFKQFHTSQTGKDGV